MSTAIPGNLNGLLNPIEAIPAGGPLAARTNNVLANQTWVTDWIDVGAWGYLHVQGRMTCAGALAGTLTAQFSTIGGGVDASVALPAVPGTGAAYDSGPITPAFQFMRLWYTQPAANSIIFDLRLMAQAVAGAGVPPPTGDVRVWSNAKGVSVSAGITSTPIDLNHEALDVNLAGAVGLVVDTGADATSLPAPNPSSYVPSTTPQSLLVEPDGALRTRARVTTDEGTFADDFARPGALVYRTLAGTSLFTLGSTAVVGALTNYLLETRVGDYVQLHADNSLAAPKWAQVAAIIDATHLTLAAAYTGAGGAAGVADVSPWLIQVSDAAGGGAVAVAASVVGLQAGINNGAITLLVRQLSTVGTRKAGSPLAIRGRFSVDLRQVNQHVGFQVTDQNGLQFAKVDLTGVDATKVTLITGSSNSTSDQLATTATLPSGTTAALHRFAVILYQTRCQLFIDDVLVADHAYHLPDPYYWAWAATTPMMLVLGVQNSAAMGGGNTTFSVDEVSCQVLDEVHALAEQPDGSKLHMTVDDMPPVAVNVDLQGQVQSKVAPNPAAVAGAVADLYLQQEPDRALRTRARVLTDEGTFTGYWPGAGAGSLYRTLSGTITFTPGSVNVTGVCNVACSCVSRAAASWTMSWRVEVWPSWSR